MMLGGIAGSPGSIMEKCKMATCASDSLRNSEHCFEHYRAPVEPAKLGTKFNINIHGGFRGRCPISMVGFLIYHASGADRLTVYRSISSRRFTYQRVDQLLRSDVFARLASDWEGEALGDWIARTIATDMGGHHLVSRVRGLYRVTAFGKNKNGRFERSKHIRISGINGTV